MKASLKAKKGQNTAEYLIMLTLIAVASIGVFSVFGQSIKAKVGQATAALAGNDGKFGEVQQKDAKLGDDAAARAVKANGMSGTEAADVAKYEAK